MVSRLLHLMIIDILATSLALRRQLFIQVRRKWFKFAWPVLQSLPVPVGG